MKSILTLALALGFMSAVAFTSCGGKKEGAEETTEQAEGEHPAEGGEHPTEGDSTDHPAAGDRTEHPAK